MALDRAGVWHDLCDIRACKDDQVDDGIVETEVWLLGGFQIVRLRVCGRHRDELLDAAGATRNDPVAA
jgi:hypothetical protein